jgi:L-ascorbate metabolism protein UlaG (beta-lactamase superfamily)
VYARKCGERELTFDFGRGLLKDNLLIVDRETSSVWSQLHGAAITGALAGTALEVLPALQTTWDFWRLSHPDTRVLELSGARARTYVYRGEQPGAEGHDTSSLGLGLADGEGALFLPLGALAEVETPLVLRRGGQEIVVHHEPDALTAWAETSGGELLPGILAYREGWRSFHPDTAVFGQDAPAEEGAGGDAGVTISLLANEGFLLTAGEESVLIDAFVAEPYAGYESVEPETMDLMIAGEGPFVDVELALVSHYHRDHFQPRPAQLFLAANPQCLLATSPQVIDTLVSVDVVAFPEDSLRDFFPAPGEHASFEHEGIAVEILHLSHGTGRFSDIQNLGHVITLGGLQILHIGDAEVVPRNFAPYRLAERGLDVAFVPYWYFGSAVGRKLIEDHFGDARLIACHIPAKDLEATVAQLARSHPDAVVFRRPLVPQTFLPVD